MSIRQEHIDSYDAGLNNLQQSIDLGRSLIDSKDDVVTKITTGFNTIGGLGQSYQALQSTKAILNKGKSIKESASNALEQSKQKAKTTDTGNDETPDTTPDENVTRTPFTQEREMREYQSPETDSSQIAETSFGEEVSTTTQESESLDQLAPMRATMEQNAQPLTATETQTRMMDFDPEGDITQSVDTQATTAGEEAENAVSSVATTSESVAPEVAEGLDLAVAGTSEIPVVGEVVAVLAGIGSAIASAFGGDKSSMPQIQQVGSDFSNTDEHSGNALSAY